MQTYFFIITTLNTIPHALHTCFITPSSSLASSRPLLHTLFFSSPIFFFPFPHFPIPSIFPFHSLICSCLSLLPLPLTHSYTQLGSTALHFAVEQGHEDIVKLLLEANADPDLPKKVIHTLCTKQEPTVLDKYYRCTLYRAWFMKSRSINCQSST